MNNVVLKLERRDRRRVVLINGEAFFDPRNRYAPTDGIDWGLQSATQKRLRLVQLLLPRVWGIERAPDDFVVALANQFAIRLSDNVEMTQEQLDLELEYVLAATGSHVFLGTVRTVVINEDPESGIVDR